MEYIRLTSTIELDENMKFRITSVIYLFLAATFAICSAAAHATPKAAEHENAPVSTGADVARPKISSAKPAKQPVTGKAKPVSKKKTVHAAKPPVTTKPMPGRK